LPTRCPCASDRMHSLRGELSHGSSLSGLKSPKSGRRRVGTPKCATDYTETGVARFFLIQHTKTGKIHPIIRKYTNWL
jgi:hypothetical protein